MQSNNHNNNYTYIIGIFIIYSLTNDMNFILGFATGLLVSTKYDIKPYVKLVEDKIMNLQKELEPEPEQKKTWFNWNFSGSFDLPAQSSQIPSQIPPHNNKKN